MADLKVDYARLQHSQETARSLSSAFDRLPKDVDRNQHIWGDDEVRGAMGEFAHNWDYRRTVLADQLKEYADKVGSCLKAFQEADDKLRDELEAKVQGR
jgi:hypothetical protein